MSVVVSPVLIARNPATGEEIGRVPASRPDEVSERVAEARAAQEGWANAPWRERRDALRRWHAVLARRAEELAEAVRDEIGKPDIEAMAAEVVSSLDMLKWTIRHAGRVLADRRVGPGFQRWLLMRAATVRRRPVGVVGIIGAWNYPILLNAPVIAHAVAIGNAVVWKPSELSARCGAILQETIEEAGFPDGLVALINGGPEVGHALVNAEIDSLAFTGGIENGRRVLSAIGGRGVPAVAELSGFDAAIVLPDAPFATSAASLVWSAFVNAGQTCTAVKRIYVVGDARQWGEDLAGRARSLRVGDPARGEVDVGPLISEAARDRFHATVRNAIDAGARVLAGAEPIDGPGWFYRPTVLMADRGDDRPERALEGCFGPVVLVREVIDADEAVSAVNASRYGLSASVWGKNRKAARTVADRLQAGAVGINEAVTFFAHASAPVGGVKASGFGRVHGAEGLLEFTATCSVFERPARDFRPHLFPYSDRLGRLLAGYRRMVHRR